ncbi:MAG: hypothetical protein AABM42_02330 [Actinomycetota bacterium]
MRHWLRSHLTYANVMVTILAFIVLGGMSYAATGGNFILGQPNSASSTTSLTAPVAGKGLQVTNNSTGAGATALGLSVASGHPPFTVNSGTKVANLNADKLDGIDSSRLEGARAYALSGGIHCPGDPVVFCSIPRGKGVAYVVKVAAGRYCVGVGGISAADPKSIADASSLFTSDRYAYWRVSNVNCVATEFEIYTGQQGFGLHSNIEFTVVIP